MENGVVSLINMFQHFIRFSQSKVVLKFSKIFDFFETPLLALVLAKTFELAWRTLAVCLSCFLFFLQNLHLSSLSSTYAHISLGNKNKFCTLGQTIEHILGRSLRLLCPIPLPLLTPWYSLHSMRQCGNVATLI